MPNDWFQFKQFKIHQDKCAMKVSTDACIQGAWAAQQLLLSKPDASKVLDIGAGTGLLTLMMAQALPNAFYDAVEINEDAYQQAIANFQTSGWENQINAAHASLAEFSIDGPYKYDFIICNPPFFQNHLESSAKARNDARHSQSLSKTELAASVVNLLKEDGMFCVLFPASEWDSWLGIAGKAGLFLQNSLSVQPKPTHACNRMTGIFRRQQLVNTREEQLVIYSAEKQYSIEMQRLLKDYYLAF